MKSFSCDRLRLHIYKQIAKCLDIAHVNWKMFCGGSIGWLVLIVILSHRVTCPDFEVKTKILELPVPRLTWILGFR